MRERIAATAGVLIAGLLLGACQDQPSQPTTEAGAGAVAPVTDTTVGALKRAPVAGRQVPFVTPTKIGRVLGDQSPSPPASR